MHNHSKTCAAAAHRGPLQHFEIAIRVAERSNLAAADVLVDANRLAGFVVDEISVSNRAAGLVPGDTATLDVSFQSVSQE